MGKNKTVGEGSAGEERYRANPEFILREVAGEVILIPLNSAAQRISGMISLTETGSFLWKRLEQQPQTKEELAVALVAEYGISQDVARADVSTFVDKAVANGMVAASSCRLSIV